MSKLFFPLRVLHGRLHDWWAKKKIEFHFPRKLLFPRGKKVFVLGTPVHSNIGDSAIVLAELGFLHHCQISSSRIKELTLTETKQYSKMVFRCLRANRHNVICWHGGGNMGDQWFPEEQFRRQAMEKLPHNPMVLFPQTLYYTPTERGTREKTASIPHYNARLGLTIVAREEKSYQEMQHLYPDTPILLTPDIVLSSTMEDYGVKKQDRAGVLFCVRSDAEKSVDPSVWEDLKASVMEEGRQIRITDMYAEQAVTKENRALRVREKMQEFCSAELVITDRLHGMVFAAITETPCIVFSNYNHKVKGTYDWIRYLPYIRFAETAEDAKQAIPTLLAMEGCHFDNAPLKPYFDKLAEVVREKCL
jgi:pyruvyl transferase EpsI